MGRWNRERIARIERGEEESIAAQQVKRIASNPLGRAILRRASHKGVVEELSKGDVSQQIDNLRGAVPDGVLAKTIKSKVPKEMDKAIKKFQKEGKEISVDTLCSEVKSTPGLLAIVPLEWFEDLAKQRMEAHKIA